MENKHNKSKSDLPGLKEWANTLLRFSENMLTRTRYAKDDHLAFMTLCFLSKQIDHMKSILLLVPSRDAILIARSMIEGLCQLLWAANSPEELPLRWRVYSAIYDWRLIKKKEALGEVIDKGQLDSTMDKVLRHGEMFLKNKYKGHGFQLEDLRNDPFQNNWRDGQSIESICVKVGGTKLYEKAYKRFSAWHHWDCTGLGQAIRRKENKVIYTSLSESDSAMALAIAFQCLIETIQLADSHFKLGLGKDITDMKERYIEWHKERGNL